METKQEKKHKILVVDDNSENIRIIGSILRESAFLVGFATGGKQALDILMNEEEDYDLVLLDVNMPEINGFEVCTTMRLHPHLKELPVIFLTANDQPEQILEGFSSGGQDYVTKPFHAGELLARIRTHLELRENREQLKQMNALLDQKVKERTRELEEANKKLGTANQELEKLDMAKVEFLRLISHEINTPLNGIIGFAGILREQLISTKYFDLIEFLNTSALRLNDFAQSSLIITDLRTVPENFKTGVINLREIMVKVIGQQKIALDEKKIRYNFNCSMVNPMMAGNENLIKTCMTHLLKNAIHYSPVGQTITIQCIEKEDSLMVSFEDNGPGFSENALKYLFKPFSHGEEHIDNNKGLGLMLVKMIIDFHHARIRISNKTDHGARVELIFDRTDPEESHTSS